jgi:hypothetical protein
MKRLIDLFINELSNLYSNDDFQSRTVEKELPQDRQKYSFDLNRCSKQMDCVMDWHLVTTASR